MMVYPTNQTSRRGGLLKAFRDSVPRNEYFAGLYILGCVNGLGARIFKSVAQSGWTDSIISFFDVSIIIWLACFVGLSFILRKGADRVRVGDLLVGAVFLFLVAIPIGGLSWLAICGLSLYILVVTDVEPFIRRGAIILLAVTVPMVWSSLVFHFFSNFILNIDAALVGWLLGAERSGNMVRLLDGSGYLVIFPSCSSIANTALTLVCWITLSQAFRPIWFLEDLLWCALASASVVAVNVSRLGIMGLSDWHYRQLHGQVGDTITNILTLIFVVSFCLLGVRRELSVRI